MCRIYIRRRMIRRVTIAGNNRVSEVVALKKEIEALKLLLYQKCHESEGSPLKDDEGIMTISKQLDKKILTYIQITQEQRPAADMVEERRM